MHDHKSLFGDNPRFGWRGGWLWLWPSGAAALLSFVAAGTLWHIDVQEAAHLSDHLRELSASESSRTSSRAMGDVPADFSAALPDEPPSRLALLEVQRAAVAAHVWLGRVQAHVPSTTPGALQRADLSVTLRGPYAGVKTVIGEVLQRYPSVTLQGLSMRLSASSTDLDASVVFSAWARPQSGPSGHAGRATVARP